MEKLIIISLAPVFALMMFFYVKDKYEKKPFRLLAKAFFYGILATIPAIILEGLLDDNFVIKSSLGSLLIYNVLGIGLIEESSKYFFVMWKLYPNKEFNEPYDGIIYAVFVALGFAALENLMYVIEGGMEVGFLRAFTAVPGHAIDGAIMGYFIGKAKFTLNTLKRWFNLFIGILFPTLTHGIYDFFASLNAQMFSLLLVFAVVIFGWRLVLRMIKIISM